MDSIAPRKEVHYPMESEGLSKALQRLSGFREKVIEKEESVLNPNAAFSKNHTRLFGTEDDHRLPYKRDVDRIIHSKAFARYTDKTQVVYLVDNDHVTHRGLHVQFVSNFARGIGEILELNLDLIEAIALGHDVGHPPFGHEGERYLSLISKENGLGLFTHSWQSCRLLRDIECLNLGLAVYDGFLCHDGGLGIQKLEPQFDKTWEQHFRELDEKKEDENKNIIPGTMEGCLVKFCDTMSYVGKDIEDAISLGILDRGQVPETSLGKTNREILAVLASDLITQSKGKNFIAISDEVHSDLKALRAFNFRNIYTHKKLKVESKKIKESYRILFQELKRDFERNHKRSVLWNEFLHSKTKRYLEENDLAAYIVDFIAGMTDSYFVRTLEGLVIPKSIQLK